MLRSVALGVTTICVLLSASILLAEDVSVEAFLEPSVVPLGGEATLVVKVKGRFRRSAEPVLPPIEGFSVYQAGTSQSFSFVNGRRSSSLEFRYVLVANQEGQFTIGPIYFETDGKRYGTSPIAVEVVRSQQSLPPPSQGTEPTGDGPTASGPIFIRGTVDRDTVYVNQQVTWTLEFYTDGTIDLLRSPEYTPPSAEGFWVEDLPPQRNYYKEMNGRRYLVNEIKRGFFPTVPGEYEIGPARVDIVVNDPGGRGFGEFFNRRLGSFGFGDSKSLTTEPQHVVVLPLPAKGKPMNFSGLVGSDLSFELRADRQVVEAGEPVNVTMEISGRGNFKAMAAPAIPTLSGFKVYESGSQSDITKNGYVVAGRKRMDFVVIPKKEGEALIPSVELAYFDPEARGYRVTRSAPIRLAVTPATQEEGGRRVVFTGAGENIEVLAKDINFIRPVPADLDIAKRPLYLNRWVLGFHALPLLAVILSLVSDRRRRRWQADTALARSSRAAREAEKRIRASRKRGPEAMWGALAGAVREYFADKMNRSPHGLTTEMLDAFLADRGVRGADRERVTHLLRECDMAQYASASAPAAEYDRLVEESLSLVRHLEKRYLA